MLVTATDRLLLRHLVPADLDALATIQADPEVMRYVSGCALSRDETAAQIERIGAYQKALGFSLWAVCEREKGTLIGRAGLLVQIVEGKPEIELAYLLARSAWGRGLGTEVATALRCHARDVVGLRRMAALVHPENRASALILAKLGMVLERRIDWHGTPRDVWAGSP